MIYRLCITLYLALAFPLLAMAQEAREAPLPLNGEMSQDGRRVTLDWFDASPRRVGSVQVRRRILGQTGGESWVTIAPDLGVVMQFTDTTTVSGVAYEYQVLRVARDVVDVGYWTTGVDLPAVDARGIAYVVVDETLSEALKAHLDRFVRDLIGDGWQVVGRTIPRGDPAHPLETYEAAEKLRSWLQRQYQQNQASRHAIILVGHVPIVTSGRVRPDGHDAVPHATDLFYADMDGVWGLGPNNMLINATLPSDAIEMQVGRIDFANLAEGPQEVALLRAYFDKNHHWRNGLLGDLREAYAQSSHLETETYSLRNVVGPQAIATGGHHDVGEEKPWLWGVDFGDYKGLPYLTAYANKAVFAINFGSGKQKFDQAYNPMTALLAQRFYPLAVGWGARPAWWLHLMALGGTIGDVHLRTVNNGKAATPYRDTMDYWPTGRYILRNPIWINLLGDPTLHAFVLAPPVALHAKAVANGVALTWERSGDPDVQSYRVYRLVQNGAVTPLNGGAAALQNHFVDTDPVADATYIVRAYGLKHVYAGSFYTLSQGIFAEIDEPLDTAETLEVRAPMGQPFQLPDSFNAPKNSLIRAVIAPPIVGDLRLDEGIWHYTPPEGFRGDVTMPYSRSGPSQTQVGMLKIVVEDAAAEPLLPKKKE